MVAFGYLVILGLFAGLIGLSFIWGVWEYRKPKDPGPLFIDLDRTTDERLEAHVNGIREAPDSKSRSLAQNVKAYQTREPIQWSSRMDETIRKKSKTATHIWMQEAETIRVRGDIEVPKGEVVPYNMIVEGNLTSDDDVTFQGGLHIRGSAIIGARNLLGRSIVCEKELVILEDVMVRNCIDCEGPVFVKRGARVGMGVEGGAIVSASFICLEKAEGPLKIRSKEGVRIVESLKEVIPRGLKPNH